MDIQPQPGFLELQGGGLLLLESGDRLKVQGANWNPEADLPESERRVITPEEFRSGVVLVTDPRFVPYFTDHPDELPYMHDRQAVGFAGCSMLSYDRALHALRAWLDSWAGVGHIAVGMHRQGFDLQLTQYDDRGWRATFYTAGMEHSPTMATGTGWERTPWRATQRAALEALRRRDTHG
jgi:hypothetical protein